MPGLHVTWPQEFEHSSCLSVATFPIVFLFFGGGGRRPGSKHSAAVGGGGLEQPHSFFGDLNRAPTLFHDPYYQVKYKRA